MIFWRGMHDRRSAEQAFVTRGQFRMVLALLMAGFLLLARSIARELAKPGS